MKKKNILLSLALLLGICNVMADNTLSVDAVTLPKNGEVDIIIKYSLEKNCRDFQFDFILPNVDGVQYSGFIKMLSTNHNLTYNNINGGIRFVGTTSADVENNLISGNGNLIAVTLKDTKGLDVSTNLTASLTNIEFSSPIDDNNVERITLSDVNIAITVGAEENFVTLNENSLIAPKATSSAVDIKVKRTIKANTWSTICLPFALSPSNLKTIFGNDVKVAECKGYSKEEDGDKVTRIIVTFEDSEGLRANKPYIIKTTKDISEFTTNKQISPSTQINVSLEDADWNPIGSVIGTYVADTTVPENSLFLSDNKFYYSTGKTKMKAFRAYFTFNDVLSSDYSAGARISFSVNGEETKVEDAEFIMTENGRIYSISGQYRGMSNENKNLPKGLYIMNGKKMIVK